MLMSCSVSTGTKITNLKFCKTPYLAISPNLMPAKFSQYKVLSLPCLHTFWHAVPTFFTFAEKTMASVLKRSEPVFNQMVYTTCKFSDFKT